MVIWIHGTIEISAIIISGAAGLVVGSSILFPGTYSRYQSFRHGIKDAMKIALALIPFLLLAAILESYVTYLMSNTFSSSKQAGLPLWAGISILAASLWLIGWYFVWYPIRLSKKIKAAATAAASQQIKTLEWPA
ncbi:stage II sporulation protein M [Phnomibacter ginsenosidimutans]|uniref:stage II sporulation protein M n=1 Tax=Phnomibacter ginsenosidimutans TaxID=2676868 RepID=UPI002484710D|nr:stage II sporulation protein M [Phnomibacter ginsenosidimutans]